METEEAHLPNEKCCFDMLFVKIAKEKCCLVISFVDIAKEKCYLAISFVDIAKKQCCFEIVKRKHRVWRFPLFKLQNTNTVCRFHLLKL